MNPLMLWVAAAFAGGILLGRSASPSLPATLALAGLALLLGAVLTRGGGRGRPWGFRWPGSWPRALWHGCYFLFAFPPITSRISLSEVSSMRPNRCDWRVGSPPSRGFEPPRFGLTCR